jgi:hypothetical protein
LLDATAAAADVAPVELKGCVGIQVVCLVAAFVVVVEVAVVAVALVEAMNLMQGSL